MKSKEYCKRNNLRSTQNFSNSDTQTYDSNVSHTLWRRSVIKAFSFLRYDNYLNRHSTFFVQHLLLFFKQLFGLIFLGSRFGKSHLQSFFVIPWLLKIFKWLNELLWVSFLTDSTELHLINFTDATIQVKIKRSNLPSFTRLLLTIKEYISGCISSNISFYNVLVAWRRSLAIMIFSLK